MSAYIRLISISVLMLLSAQLHAQAVAQNVLDELVISKSGFTGIIKIIFRVPMRYITHNPSQVGKEIRIKMDFLNANIQRNVTRNTTNHDTNSNNRFGSGSDSSGFGVNSDDRGFEILGRESLVPKYKDSFGLIDVSYEKVVGDNYVTLHFKKNVSFEIIQDASYRSISILIHDVK